ncbi:MAG: 16S rRNA (guanine(527)-N(7))-methyltransferase RsmG [Limnochordia bacterium]|nr:16S rRNA (guanine(527)-N(7))-methyltransferase RsmG [Limnochordia bacterium]
MSFEREVFQTALETGLKAWDLEEFTPSLPAFADFAESVVETNQTLNLTRIVEPEEMAIKNFLDSLAVLRLEWPQSVSCLDLGTGAGFPGVPLAIVKREWSFVLLDSLRKRLRFLQGTATSQGLTNLGTLHARAEDAGQDKTHRQGYDLVLSRAVAHLPVLLELATPLTRVGGRFVAYKGSEAVAELKASSQAMKELNLDVELVFDIDLPLEMGARTLLVFRKLRPTPPSYPRKAGIPNKQPL